MEIAHAELGRLIWEQRYDQYKGTICRDGRTLFLYAVPDDRQDPERKLGRSLEALLAALGDLDAWRLKAAERLVEMYAAWNDNESIQAQALADKFVPESVTALASGELELYFEDGDAFHGHVVVLTVGAEGKVTDVKNAG